MARDVFAPLFWNSAMIGRTLAAWRSALALALLFHLIDGGEGSVGVEPTARALDWSDYLRSHANRLYSSGSLQIEHGARIIIECRAQLPERFTLRDVQRKAWGGLTDKESARDAIDLLVANNHCRGIHVEPTATGGRPSLVYEWHPGHKGAA
jgi:hypothetical protein